MTHRRKRRRLAWRAMSDTERLDHIFGELNLPDDADLYLYLKFCRYHRRCETMGRRFGFKDPPRACRDAPRDWPDGAPIL